MQLDIFEHSRDTMLRNDVLDALLRTDAAASQVAWQRLDAEYPLDASLPPLARLIAALAQRDATPFADQDGVRGARLALSDEVEPAARRLFGVTAGAAWLLPLWREAAQRAEPIAWQGARAQDHAAPLWLRAGEWARAMAAIERIESWRRIPAPLAWMAEACWRLDGLGGHDAEPGRGWALLAELAWLAPARLETLSLRLADAALDRLRKKFDATFEGLGGVDDLAWFPAWMLTEQPGLARWLGQAQASLHSEPERAMRLILDLLSLERQGRHHDVIAKRKLLRDLQPSIYGAYMKSR